MGTKRDLRVPANAICFQALGAVQSSVLFRALSATWRDVEVWAALNPPTDDFTYFWLVSLRDGAVWDLACVRYSCRGDMLQERIQGPFRQVFWEPIERSPSQGYVQA